MKICTLVHNPPFQGGLVQYSILLENELVKKKNIKLNICGFNKLYPPFLYKGKLPKENKSGIDFVTKSKNFVTWYNPLSWLKVYFELKKSDIFHFHWVSPLLAPLQYLILKLNKMFSKKIVIMNCHNIEPHESTIFDKIFTNMVFNHVDHFIVHAKQNVHRLINDYKIPKNRVHLVPHGTFGYFTKWSKKNKEELKKQFGFEGKKVILFFGYIRKYKGLRYLIKAMKDVVEKDKNVRLIVAGELWEKWSDYKHLIDKFNLGKYIKVFPHYIEDKKVHKFFNASDIVVLPYHNTEQTISGPLLISFAFGKPTIVSSVGGVKEVVNKNNGVLVEGGNVKQLSNEIIRLLNDKKLQKKLGTNAKKLNDSEFSWNKIAEEVYKIYKKVLKC